MYYILFFLAYLLSLLPLFILYRISDFAYFLLYRLTGYRKKIVWNNLKQSFPQKSDTEIQQIQKQFYRSFCDQWMETLKLISAPMRTVKKHMSGNFDIFNKAIAAGNGRVVVMLAHQFNWEWGHVATPLYFRYNYAGVYLPLKTKAVDRLLSYLRKRSGAALVPANNLRASFKEMAGTKNMLAFIADQTPASLKVASWHRFMNRPTPFLTGPEKVARRQEAAVVFVALRKKKRGHYALFAQQICTNAKTLNEGEVLKKYVSFLEQELHRQPANWLWSHRRWKKKPPEDLAI